METVELRVIANGDVNEWTYQIPGSGEHWDKVDETFDDYDDDTTHLLHYSVNYKRELFQIESPPLLVGITNVLVRTRYKNSTIRTLIKTHGTVYAIVGWSYGGGWGWWVENWAKNPYTGNDWTQSEIEDLQIGLDGKWYLNPSRFTTIFCVVNCDSIAKAASAFFM